MSNEELIEAAKAVVGLRQLAGDNTAGMVGASLISEKGDMYRGVCIDTSSGMGFCAEHAAAAAMITAGETKIRKIVAVWKGDDGVVYVLPPCGRCREFMKQIDSDNLGVDVVLGKDKTVKLEELLPYHGWPEPLG